MAFSSQSGEDVSGRNLSLGLWFARNQENARKVGVAALGVLAGACVLFALVMTWSWATHISQTTDIWENMALSGLRFENRVAPTPVSYSRSEALRRDDESVDAIVQITNPNTQYAAVLTYEFVVGGQALSQRTVTLAPQQDYFAAAVRVPSAGDSNPSVQARTVGVQWKRLVNREALPQEDWRVSNPSFDVVRLVQNQQQEVSQLGMTLTNGSPYGFVEPEIVVELKDASGSVVAINSASLNRIDSLASQELLFQWPGRLPESLTADVHVNVDLVDEQKRILSRELEAVPQPSDEE